ncbi:MAG: S1 RNA-binding domain-containing protein [Candidatus Altiarchaeota archaeon]|nr:S1 RNA-binding domain-containing protein [Candidatus Altiarchaeota archaeon]
MIILKDGGPEEGDIVLAIVVRVEQHAVFVKLEEYENIEGLIHISEVSKSWVKNIKTHFRDKQKVVCKILDVKNPEYVHASIRRVSDYDKRAKWDQIKRKKRIENIIEIIAKKAKKTPDEVYSALQPYETKYGEIYFAFEESKKVGVEFFKDTKMDKAIWEVVDKNIALPVVEVQGNLNLSSTASDGIERIKELLKGIDAEVLYLGAPNYRISVKDNDYKQAEKKLSQIVDKIKSQIGKTENFTFDRERKK